MPKKPSIVKTRRPAVVAIAAPRREFKTVVVVGSGRGGTSAIAGAIHLLGVRMVEGGHELNSEDREIVMSYQRNMHEGHRKAAEEVSRIIAERNARYDSWGWKDPSADLYLESVITQIRNPHFVMVFRNPLEVAQSHMEKGTPGIEVGIDAALNRYVRYWLLLQKFRCPTLMVSYERAMSDPSGFVDEACGFLDLKPRRNERSSAIAFLDPAGGYRGVRGRISPAR
jgi:hypothetical protein